jgi:hypothetical protein
VGGRGNTFRDDDKPGHINGGNSCSLNYQTKSQAGK